MSYNEVISATYNKKGLEIKFISNKDIFPNDLCRIGINGKYYYFEVQNVYSNTNMHLYVLAKEYGYYNLPSKDKIALHKIINNEIEVIQDVDIIKKLRQESSYL